MAALQFEIFPIWVPSFWNLPPTGHAISIKIAETSSILQAHPKPLLTLSLSADIVQSKSHMQAQVHSTCMKRNCKRTGNKHGSKERWEFGTVAQKDHNYNEHCLCICLWNVVSLKLSSESKVGRYTLLIYIHVRNLHTLRAWVIEICYILKLLSKGLIQAISRLLLFISLFLICWLLLCLRYHLSSGSPGQWSQMILIFFFDEHHNYYLWPMLDTWTSAPSKVTLWEGYWQDILSSLLLVPSLT